MIFNSFVKACNKDGRLLTILVKIIGKLTNNKKYVKVFYFITPLNVIRTIIKVILVEDLYDNGNGLYTT